MLIGERIRAARQRLKLTQSAMAKAVGVEQPTVSGWESDPMRRPSRQLVPVLARVLKVTPNWLEFGGADEAGRPYGEKADEDDAQRSDVALDTQLLTQVIEMAMRAIIKPHGLDIPDRRYQDAADAAASAYANYFRLGDEEENAA